MPAERARSRTDPCSGALYACAGACTAAGAAVAAPPGGVADGAEDSDEDGISNRGESRLHSNCGQDSNRVEIHRATVTSFENNVLTLALAGGGIAILTAVFEGVFLRPTEKKDTM